MCQIRSCFVCAFSPLYLLLSTSQFLLSPKTLLMQSELDAGVLHRYVKEEHLFYHHQVAYRAVTRSLENLSSHPTVSIGSSPAGRELIILDPKNSPLLNEAYRHILTQLSTCPSLSLKEKLSWIAAFVREKVFDPQRSTEENLERFVQKWEDTHPLSAFTPTLHGGLVPVIPIDDFIAAKVGICRHLALVTTYVVDRLIQETPYFPLGKVFSMRDVIHTSFEEGGHAWTLYVSPEESWHIDSLWGILLPLEEKENLYFYYGQEAIERELQFVNSFMYTSKRFSSMIKGDEKTEKAAR